MKLVAEMKASPTTKIFCKQWSCARRYNFLKRLFKLSMAQTRLAGMALLIVVNSTMSEEEGAVVLGDGGDAQAIVHGSSNAHSLYEPFITTVTAVQIKLICH